MIRIHLSQLVKFLESIQMAQAASFFSSFENSESTVDGWIESNFVKWYITHNDPSSRTWREIQANVPSLIP
jgi:hypothetical protein